MSVLKKNTTTTFQFYKFWKRYSLNNGAYHFFQILNMNTHKKKTVFLPYSLYFDRYMGWKRCFTSSPPPKKNKPPINLPQRSSTTSVLHFFDSHKISPKWWQCFTSWWLNQPNWKIMRKSNFIISPGIRVKIKKYLKPPPQVKMRISTTSQQVHPSSPRVRPAVFRQFQVTSVSTLGPITFSGSGGSGLEPEDLDPTREDLEGLFLWRSRPKRSCGGKRRCWKPQDTIKKTCKA